MCNVHLFQCIVKSRTGHSRVVPLFCSFCAILQFWRRILQFSIILCCSNSSTSWVLVLPWWQERGVGGDGRDYPAQFNLHSPKCTLHQCCTVYHVPCTCTMHGVSCTLQSVPCTLHGVPCSSDAHNQLNPHAPTAAAASAAVAAAHH